MIPAICLAVGMFAANLAICDTPPGEYRVEAPIKLPPALTNESGSVTTVELGNSVKGEATWYCDPPRSRCTKGYAADGNYAAAGPELRKALGPGYKGTHVWVNGVEVILVDFCACGGDHVIDVYHSTWVTIPDQGHVTVSW
jgi:hypothetical protein